MIPTVSALCVQEDGRGSLCCLSCKLLHGLTRRKESIGSSLRRINKLSLSIGKEYSTMYHKTSSPRRMKWNFPLLLRMGALLNLKALTTQILFVVSVCAVWLLTRLLVYAIGSGYGKKSLEQRSQIMQHLAYLFQHLKATTIFITYTNKDRVEMNNIGHGDLRRMIIRT